MKKWLKNFKKDQRGLTLVELLAVVVILAIVAAIAFVLIGNIIENSRKDAHISNAQQMISAAKLYEASGNEINGSVNIQALQSAGNLGPLTDPWNKKPYASGQVTKSGNDYSVTLTAADSADSDCKLSNVPENILNQGRGTACNYQ